MLAGATLLSANDVYGHGDVKEHALGQVGVDKWGDVYRYAKLASDVSAGYLLVSLSREANHQNIALSEAASAGDLVVKPTVGATAVDANEYDEGVLVFNDVSPEGEWYRITSHDSSAGSEAIDVNLERPLLTAATTSSEVSLVRNVWNCPAVSQLIAERAAGVPVADIDYSEKPYAWLKTRGMASVLVDNSGITVGLKATISNEDDGRVGLYSDVDAEFEVGQMMATGTNDEFNPIYLTID
jgi:hypothetical protein